MKKLIIPFLLVMALVFQSCEETQSPIYDGSQTLAYFPEVTSRVEVELNTTSTTITIPVNASTLSSSDRTVNVSIVESSTTAASNQYSFNGQVTIPANSYFGSLDLTGFINNLTTTGVTLTLQLEDGIDEGGVASPATHTVTIVLICPVADTFAVGDYTLDHVGGGIPAAGFAPTMGDGVTVTLVPGASSTERVFNVKFYPTFGFTNPPVDFSFNLICEATTVNGIINNGVSGVGCGSSIPMGPSPNSGTYSSLDDTTMTVIFIEDVGGASCGTEAETTVRLTKQ